ncbi:MAG: ribonuclease HII [Alphaproteobacteria bacterium]|nr:ribonuclease HII [Alphaproteobacteria bacterium]
MPDFTLETIAMDKCSTPVAGVDEVGRGPLSGPVVAAAVILDPANIPDGLADSKKLSAKRRELLFDLISASAIISVAEATVAEIDSINILQASLLAMRRALDGLATRPGFALIDGNRTPPDLAMPAQAVVKGDDRCLSIAAASIIAKVTRDRLMTALSREFPGYGWENNAGYGTKQHLEGLKRLGVTPHHRVSFKPVHNILYQEKN